MKPIPLALLSCFAVLSALGQAIAPTAASLGSCSQSLQAPARVAADPSGNIYVTDPAAGQVVVFDSFGRQAAVQTGFAGPLGIAVDAQGRFYLGEEQTGSVSAFDSQGNFLYKLGAGDGEFQLPNHLAIDPATATVYVSDSKANAVKFYAGAALAGQFGGGGTGNGQFDFPAGLCVSPSGEVFVVDQNNDRAQVFDRSGGFKRAFGLSGGGMSLGPSGRSQAAAIDAAGRLYVVDTFQGAVKVFDGATGSFLSTVGSFGQSPGQLTSPAGIALDANNTLFVTSAGTRRVELYGLDSYLRLSVQPGAGTIAAGTNLVFTAATGGAGPFTYQWLKNGIALSGATNALLAINSAGLADAGGYSLMVSGASGMFLSGVAQVAVMAPPAILANPQSLTVFRGSNAVFAVSSLGAGLSYQWQLNGLNVEGATNSALFLADVQSFQAGQYSVVVNNSVGTALSAPALLTVMVAPSLMEIVSCAVAADQLLHLTINADPGFAYALEASTDFLQWQPLTNFVYDAGMVDFADAGATNYWNRFYRLRWAP